MAIPGLFFFIVVFSIIQLVDNVVDEILPMRGFEPRISGVRSDHSTNWATTTAHLLLLFRQPPTKLIPDLYFQFAKFAYFVHSQQFVSQ